MNELKYITLEVQSIESAPRDIEIQVYRGDDSAVVFWSEIYEGWKFAGTVGDQTFDDPTHWSPKPVLSAAVDRPGYSKIPLIKLTD